MRRRALLTLFGLSLVAAGCGDGQAMSTRVEGTWWAEKIDDEPIVLDANAARIPWFRLDEGAVDGNLGCNDFGGTYVVVDDTLFGMELVQEAALCGGARAPADPMMAERLLGRMLTRDAGVRVRVEGEQMTWSGAGHDITFRAQPGAPPWPVGTAEPPTEWGRLSCDSGRVEERRVPDDGTSREALAARFAPETVVIEHSPDQPLQWWGLDASGRVVIGLLLGDVPDADYQIVTCTR